MKIGLVSLGCSKNLIDTQTAMKFLSKQGHVFTSNVRDADVIIVNTCAFINDAKQRKEPVECSVGRVEDPEPDQPVNNGRDRPGNQHQRPDEVSAAEFFVQQNGDQQCHDHHESD